MWRCWICIWWANKQEKIIPTAIIVDPPRKGLDEKTIQNILKIKPEKLVYISCNPSTMVRDIAKMEDVYVAEKYNL